MRSTAKYILLVVFMAFTAKVSAQSCGTDEYVRDLLENDSAVATFYQKAINGEVPSFIEYKEEGSYKKATRIIPVVFHIFHQYGPENISKEQIEDQMRILNEDFQRLNADTVNTRSIFKGDAVSMEIEFRLARKDPLGNCTEGITRHFSTLTDGGDDQVKSVVRWDYKRYLNIWVISRISRGGFNGGTVLGYAVFPDATSSQTDGIVIRHDRVGSIGTAVSDSKGRTLTHEVGHWLGLYHTFQGGCTNNQTLTDRVEDTPPAREPNYGCPTGVNSCTNDPGSSGDRPDQVENYMDYSGDACMNLFTRGQKARVDFFLSNQNFRAPNISATTLNATGVNTNPFCGPIADFHTENLNTIICEGNGTINFRDYSYNGDIASRQWIFEGGTPSTSNAPNPSVQYSTPGLYDVTLIVSNGEGSDTLTRKEFITSFPTVAVRKAPFGEDFQGPNYAIGWQIEGGEGSGWNLNTSRGFNSSRSMEAQISSSTETGARYSLIMPPVDVLGHGAPININFRHAYSRRFTTSSEVLIIMVSENCGESWAIVRGLTASNGLASVSGTSADWRPTNSSQWAYHSINLNSYSASRNLMVRFDVISQSGNSVFLDDINLGQFPLSAPTLSLSGLLKMYPNPAQDVLNLDVDHKLKGARLEIQDLSGRLLLQQELNAGEELINIAHLLNGMYIVRVSHEGTAWTEKLIINK